MNENLPSVTVIIAARPEQALIKAVGASCALDYPADKLLQIIVARGKQPSAQRNAGLQAAQGELIYFLDDDSVPAPQNLKLAAAHFNQPGVAMVGGPNLCPEESSALEKVFAVVLSSWLAFGPSRARYTPVGGARKTSEKELILCNLVARRQEMLQLGGFNEALYPNEENALMDELQKRGKDLIYDPRLVVARRPRPNLKSFVKMLLTYGRGRAEQFRLHPTFGSALNFVPPVFVGYLLLLCVAVWAAPKLGWWLLFGLGLYAAALLGQLLFLAPSAGLVRSVAAMPLIFLTHVLYGAGFWRGLFTSLKPAPESEPVKVQLEFITARSGKSSDEG